MNRPIITRKDASDHLLASGWSSQTVQGRVVEQTGHFFLLCSRFTVCAGEDTLASFADSTATLVEVVAEPGTTLTLILGATGELWSSQGVASSETSENTTDIPNWFKGGLIGFERQNTVFDPRVPVWFYSDATIHFGPNIA